MTAPAADWYPTAERVIRKVAAHWRSFAVLGLAGAVAGGVTAFLLPSYFRAGAAFQAEAGPLNQLSGALAGLASQLGGVQAGPQTSPQAFGYLLGTDAVLRRVVRATFPWKGDSVTLDVVYGYDRAPPGRRSYYSVRKLRAALAVDINIRTGVVSFSIEARTPQLALALAESTLVALNEVNIAVRQARAGAERAFTAGRADHARSELAAAESTLAQFYEHNRVLANSPALQMEEARLRRVVDMAQQVYIQLRLQEEHAAVQEVRNTPAISVIDPPLLPVRRSWPNRRLAVVCGFLIGVAAALARLSLAA